MEMSVANENRRLREIVQQLLDKIDDNQKVLKHFQAFEVKLLDTAGIHQLLNLLLDESCRHFRLASASLLLLDENGQLDDLFGSIQVGNFHNRLQLRQNPDFYHKIYTSDPEVMLQEVDVLTATRLFPGAPKVGSAAFLPLLHQHRVIGSLHLASSESSRFTSAKDANLLEHMAAIVSRCVSHCLEREAQELQQEIDPVLQIGSERYLQRALNRELERTATCNGYLACVVVQANAVANVESALPKVAQVIRDAVRKVDVCASMGDNQFVVLLPESDSRQAQATAARISKSLCDISDLPKDEIKVGVNAWKARKSKNPISEEKLVEVGQSLLQVAAANAQPLAE